MEETWNFVDTHYARYWSCFTRQKSGMKSALKASVNNFPQLIASYQQYVIFFIFRLELWCMFTQMDQFF